MAVLLFGSTRSVLPPKRLPAVLFPFWEQDQPSHSSRDWPGECDTGLSRCLRDSGEAGGRSSCPARRRQNSQRRPAGHLKLPTWRNEVWDGNYLKARYTRYRICGCGSRMPSAAGCNRKKENLTPTNGIKGRMRFKMVGPRRFELLTFCTPSKRATSLRYGPIKQRKQGVKVSATFLTVKERIK